MESFYTLKSGKWIPNLSKKDVERVNNLKIPPNWNNITVSKDPNSKVQVIGYDSKNREQRIYNDDWISKSEKQKYRNVNKLDSNFNNFKKILNKFMNYNDLSHDCVVANVINLLLLLNIRVGNEIYFEENGTCGITTMRNENLKKTETKYYLNFVGKKGIKHCKSISSPRIKLFLDKMKNIQNEHLFCYVKENNIYSVTSLDVNKFIKKYLGENYSAKDLRTYNANIIFKNNLSNYSKPKTEKEANQYIRESIKVTAEKLGNTTIVCKKSYIDPKFIEKYLSKIKNN